MDGSDYAAGGGDADAGVELLRQVLPRQLHGANVLGVLEEGEVASLCSNLDFQ